MTTKFQDLAEEALNAFWDVMVQKFPEIKTGDLSPLTTIRLTAAAGTAVEEWIRYNDPATFTIPGAKYTPGPWKIVLEDDFIAVKTDDGDRIADVYATPSVDEDEEAVATALLIAAAPDLRRESKALYDAINAYLDVADSELPEDLVAGFGGLEAAWHKADGTKPEPNE